MKNWLCGLIFLLLLIGPASAQVCPHNDWRLQPGETNNNAVKVVNGECCYPFSMMAPDGVTRRYWDGCKSQEAALGAFFLAEAEAWLRAQPQQFQDECAAGFHLTACYQYNVGAHGCALNMHWSHAGGIPHCVDDAVAPPPPTCDAPNRMINGVCTPCNPPGIWVGDVCTFVPPPTCDAPNKMINGVCTACNSPNTWVGDVCTPPPTCDAPNKMINGVCTACNAPNAWVGNVCTPPPTCDAPNKMINGVCTPCNAPGVWVGDVCTLNPPPPPTCDAPNKLINGVCTPCNPPGVWVGDVCSLNPPPPPTCDAPNKLINGVCTACDAPNVWVGDVCTAPTCPPDGPQNWPTCSCPAGWYWDSNEATCMQVLPPACDASRCSCWNYSIPVQGESCPAGWSGSINEIGLACQYCCITLADGSTPDLVYAPQGTRDTCQDPNSIP